MPYDIPKTVSKIYIHTGNVLNANELTQKAGQNATEEVKFVFGRDARALSLRAAQFAFQTITLRAIPGGRVFEHVSDEVPVAVCPERENHTFEMRRVLLQRLRRRVLSPQNERQDFFDHKRCRDFRRFVKQS